jgi:SAM-dependent methyltransferase
VTDPIDGNRDAVRRGGEIYDNPEFLDNYLKLRQKRAGLNEAIEIPALTRLLPEVHGIDILELGCGNGKLARSLAAIGARHVLAVDGSRSMLATATRAPRVTYVHASIEDIRLRPTTVDLIVSSLALHYVADFDSVIARPANGSDQGGISFFLPNIRYVRLLLAIPRPRRMARGDSTVTRARDPEFHAGSSTGWKSIIGRRARSSRRFFDTGSP